MPDHQHYAAEEGRPATQSERIGQWENEGGSLRSPLPAKIPIKPPSTPAAKVDCALLQALPLPTLLTNDAGMIIQSNRAVQRLYAASATELLGQPWQQFIDSSDRPSTEGNWQEICDHPMPFRFEARLVSRAGERIWARYSIASLDSTSAGAGCVHTIEDISAIKTSALAADAANQALSCERERARVTLESIGDAVISTDSSGRVTYLNAVAEELTGWAREAAFGRAFNEVFRVLDSNTGKPADNAAKSAMESLAIIQMAPNCLLQRLDGSELAIEDSAAPILDAEGELIGAVVVFRDQKMSRKTTAQMAHVARHDVLTGLPNRLAFAEHFKQAINLARRHHHRVGLMFIDLDRFKWINDTLGHEAGDQLLQEVSRNLVSCVRSTDLVGRHGGDEFVVLLSEVERPVDVRRIAEKMKAAAAAPTLIQGQLVRLQLSIGISLYPEHGADIAQLFHCADAAMYEAKLAGGDACAFYHAGLDNRPQRLAVKSLANVRQRTDCRGATGNAAGRD